MASLRARHSKTCALAGRETAAPKGERDKIPGCSCKPVYSIRGAAGQGYDRVGHNLRVALRAIGKRQVDEDAGEYRAPENLTFEAWADRWIGQLTRPSSRTIDEYKATVGFAKDTFGTKLVRRITADDVAEMLKEMRDRKVSASTQAKHLRVLGACFRSAVLRGYAGSNPIGRLADSERPQPQRRESGYFTDAEMKRLLKEIPAGLWRTLFSVAFTTGLRQGELSAITWKDVDLQGGTLRVRRTYSGGQVGPTKGRTARTVDLPKAAVDLLGAWWGESGKPRDDALVFPREDGGGYQPFWRFTKTTLYPALKRAGIDRVGPTGAERDFHSTRHTYARIVLEKGLPLSWLSRQLGHSSESVTDRHYGHWSREGSKLEAKRLEGAFKL